MLCFEYNNCADNALHTSASRKIQNAQSYNLLMGNKIVFQLFEAYSYGLELHDLFLLHLLVMRTMVSCIVLDIQLTNPLKPCFIQMIFIQL